MEPSTRGRETLDGIRESIMPLMREPKSVTQWIEDLKLGDEDAAAQLWDRYFRKMVQQARRRLQRNRRDVVDAEDVALSAFDCLCRGAANGNFTWLKDRQGLWPLLLTITAHKCIDRIRREDRQCRGGGRVLRESELPDVDDETTIDEILRQGPTPDFLVLMEEQHAHLLSQLRDDTMRQIVNWKLEGYSNKQIGKLLGISVHSVGRKLRLIRLAWAKRLNET